jgi:type I restriction enzyme S subunit
MMSKIPAGYKQTEVGVIPEDWEARSIGEIAKFSGGSQPPRSTFRFQPKEGYTRLIQIRDYKSDEYETYVPTHLARKFCTAQEIMIGRYGPPIFQILKGIDGAYNVALLKASPQKNVDPEYLYSFLKQDSLLHFVEGLSQRSSGQTGIEMPALKTYPVPLPPLPEQKRIAQVLGDVDALIQKLEALIAKKRDIKQAAMQELLTGKRRLPGFRGPWETKKLGEVAALTKGTQMPEDLRVDAGYPHLNGGTTFSGCCATHNSPSNTITISEGGNSCGFVNLIMVPFWCGGHCYTVRPYRGNQALLYHVLKLSEPRIMELRVGSGLPNIQRARLLGFQLKQPLDEAEQTAIAQVLSDMDNELAQLETRLGKTRDLKAGLMQQLLTGKIRLR